MNTKAQNRGFTIIELMMTLAVMSILLVVGVPAFQTFVQNNRQTSDHNGLIMALLSARSGAVRTNVPVVVCTSTNGTQCSGSANWEDGWIVFTDVVNTDTATEEGVVNAASGGGTAALCETDEDCVLGVYDSLGAGSTLRLAGAGSAITYNSTGVSDVSDTFTMCVPDTTVKKQVIISSTGRPMTGQQSPTGSKVTSCP